MADTPARWTITSSQGVYDNPFIHVREYQTIAPTGAPALYGLVHMKRLAMGVLPIDQEGCTFLVGQERFPFGRYSWELPEGGADPSLPPRLGAARELAEETGFEAMCWLELFSEVQLSNSVTDERAFAFLAWDLRPASGAAHKDASEDLRLRRLPFPEAVAMAVSGEIVDVFSLVMLLKADHLARTGGLPADLSRLLCGR
jgi:8-oxo-dGTP pyrophosphatase MutT (NUDIX family)